MLEGTATTLRFTWQREGQTEIPLFDAGLGDPVLLRWRELELEQALPRLPGGPGSLERLRDVLEKLPADAPGRPRLEAVAGGLAEARRLLDAAQAAIQQYAAADAALDRARAAAEDRTGAAREAARQRLNQASMAAESAGAAADAAWEAWRAKVREVVALTG
jgi:hypothetical protein